MGEHGDRFYCDECGVEINDLDCRNLHIQWHEQLADSA